MKSLIKIRILGCLVIIVAMYSTMWSIHFYTPAGQARIATQQIKEWRSQLSKLRVLTPERIKEAHRQLELIESDIRKTGSLPFVQYLSEAQLLIGLIAVLAGFGLWRMQKWARVLAISQAVVSPLLYFLSRQFSIHDRFGRAVNLMNSFYSDTGKYSTLWTESSSFLVCFYLWNIFILWFLTRVTIMEQFRTKTKDA